MCSCEKKCTSLEEKPQKKNKDAQQLEKTFFFKLENLIFLVSYLQIKLKEYF